jgi:glycosyltransferase involved in cell wall biosynthesis
MKVLISAKACSPYWGSESQVGWSAVRCLAKDHDLWVITGKRNQADLERADSEGLIPKNVRFIYTGSFGQYSSNRMRARFQDWNEYMGYSRAILPVAEDLHRRIQFDLAHHVTIATWRVASPLWQLGIPFVFGPVGGNEKFPLRFLPMLSGAARAFELCRMGSNMISRLSPAVRSCLCRSSHVLASNPDTAVLATRLRGSDANVTCLSQAFFTEDKIKAFAASTAAKNLRAPLRLIAGGNMEGRKGVALALQALARVKSRAVKFHYQFGGEGPELGAVRNLAANLGLQDDVLLGESLSGPAYREALAAAHVFLLPSFRESSGLTMMEAMLAGCVPVVADCGGPAGIVTDDCGYKIAVSNPEQMVSDLASTILMIDRQREIILKKGCAAAERIATGFSEGHYRKVVGSVYASMLQAKEKPG